MKLYKYTNISSDKLIYLKSTYELMNNSVIKKYKERILSLQGK